METIVIAGGFGFVGKNMIEQLSSKFRLIIIDKYVDEDFAINHYVSFYQNNFNNSEEIKNILEKEHPDYIINLVSIVTAKRDLKLFEEMITSNLMVFLSLYEASQNLSSLKLFVQFGSAEEYGNINPPFLENNRESPMSPYALIKQLTTNTAIMLNRNYSFPVCVVRPGNIFGKYQNRKKFIPYIISSLINDESLKVSSCEQKRDFIHVVDLIKVVEKILINSDKAKGEILNVSYGKSISLKEIIIYCRNETNSKSKINFGFINYRENEMMNFICDIRKVENIIGGNIESDFYNKLKLEIDRMRF